MVSHSNGPVIQNCEVKVKIPVGTCPEIAAVVKLDRALKKGPLSGLGHDLPDETGTAGVILGSQIVFLAQNMGSVLFLCQFPAVGIKKPACQGSFILGHRLHFLFLISIGIPPFGAFVKVFIDFSRSPVIPSKQRKGAMTLKYVKLGTLQASSVVMGGMRIADKKESQVDRLIRTALDQGITLFDHADIYGGGNSEALFGSVLAADPGLRPHMQLQSKCGIRKGFYDFSYEHIMSSAEKSLKRLHTDYLDLLLFHRPDVLAEQEEFSRAVQDLKVQGKVCAFGVSNMNPAQVQLLEAWTGEKMAVNQVQLSLLHAGLVTASTNVNVHNPEGTMYDGSLLPFARRTDLGIQAWSPLQYGMFEGCFVGNEKFPALNACLQELSQKYQVAPAAVALAWILRIPGKMQVVTGTADPGHLVDACEAADISLSREDWYALYRACGYLLP